MRCFHDLVFCIFLTWAYESERAATGEDEGRAFWEYKHREWIAGYSWSLDGLQAT
jgi:hypothetical protein